MKFGKTKEQLKAERLERVTKMLSGEGEIRFAWRPITLHDGRKVWLEKYKAIWTVRKGFHSTEALIKDYVLDGDFGMFQYRGALIEEYVPVN